MGEPGPTVPRHAERRQLTVMFCDLVGSTALSARLDPEDLQELLRAYQAQVKDVVRVYGGYIARFMGDGALVYFGYPQAHEDDAERAVRAGLALVSSIGQLDTATREPLNARIGIATGLVVVGDLIGSGEAQERRIAGETPNLAARLQGLAEPGTVIIADGRGASSAICSSSLGSRPPHSRVSRSRCGPGASSGKATPRAGSRRCTAHG